MPLPPAGRHASHRASRAGRAPTGTPYEDEDCMWPFRCSQKIRVGAYVLRHHLTGRQALPARADAGAAVPLQPRLRRLRQDRLSRRRSSTSAFGRGMPRRGRRVRRAGRRRSPAASRCCTSEIAADRRGHHRAQEIRLSSAPTRCCWKRRSTSTSRTRSSPGRSISTATRRCTTGRCARTASTTARSRRIKLAKARGFRVNINATLFNNAEPERVAHFFDSGHRDGRRRHHRLARLCL